jgi:tetratricopeptide (TPR) repeat protein
MAAQILFRKIALGSLALLLCGARPLLAANDFTSLLHAGDAAAAAHDPRKAVHEYQRAAKLQPDAVDLLLKLSQRNGDLIGLAKNRAEAAQAARQSLDYAKRAVKLAPENAAAHLAVSIGYGRLTDFVDNRTKLQYAPLIKSEADRATQLDPNNDVAWLVLGRWTSSMAHLNPVLRYFAELVYGKLPVATNADALKFLRKAVALEPQSIINHQALAEAYEAAGNHDSALGEWRTVLTLPSVDADDEAAKTEARAALN